jgi:tripartite-type tricarboxylate transporter receptor subunit TctC
VLVETKPGASGLLGANQMLQAAADGHVVTILPEAGFRIPQLQKTLFDPIKDLTYIAHLAGYCFAMGVRADAPWKTWSDLVADARKNPGKISFTSAGVNTTFHFTMEELMLKAAIKLNHVPYKGEADSVSALLGGHVDIGIASGALSPHVVSGRVRPLMVWTPHRVKRYPNVPTLREAGYDMVSMAPFGLVGPKGMSPGVVKTLQDAFKSALEGPGRSALERLELENAYLGSTEYTEYAHSQFKRQRALIERLGIQKS